MSAAAQIREMVESVVRALTGETDRRLDALEKDVADLKDRLSPPEKAARAQTARGSGSASRPRTVKDPGTP